MRVLSLRTAAVLLVAGVGLGGCAYGPYGGLGVGIGYGDGYYDPYYGGYSPYGYYGSRYGAYGAPYWGWYDNYYYPGTGYYVYDRYRNPYYWSDSQRRYWERRRQAYNRGDSPTNRIVQQWGDFQNGGRTVTTNNVIRQRSYEPSRTVRRQEWIGRAREQAERRQDQAERRESRAESRREFIEQRRSEVRERARGKRGDD
jgi:hypothetical protein